MLFVITKSSSLIDLDSQLVCSEGSNHGYFGEKSCCMERVCQMALFCRSNGVELIEGYCSSFGISIKFNAFICVD